MAKSKVKFGMWKNAELKFRTVPRGYLIEGATMCSLSSEHGRTRNVVTCPCCDRDTVVFVWSYRGGGKRCNHCKVLLAGDAAFVAKEDITSEVIVIDTFIKKA